MNLFKSLKLNCSYSVIGSQYVSLLLNPPSPSEKRPLMAVLSTSSPSAAPGGRTPHVDCKLDHFPSHATQRPLQPRKIFVMLLRKGTQIQWWSTIPRSSQQTIISEYLFPCFLTLCCVQYSDMLLCDFFMGGGSAIRHFPKNQDQSVLYESMQHVPLVERGTLDRCACDSDIQVVCCGWPKLLKNSLAGVQHDTAAMLDAGLHSQFQAPFRRPCFSCCFYI